jgi:hypothetical protein
MLVTYINEKNEKLGGESLFFFFIFDFLVFLGFFSFYPYIMYQPAGRAWLNP